MLPLTMHSEENNFSYTFQGSPQPFKAVLRELAGRFDRPLLPKDPFDNEPFSSFEEAYKASRIGEWQDESDHASAEQGVAQVPLRDPRLSNVVCSNNLSVAQRAKQMKEAVLENFAGEQEVRVEKVEVGQLYLLELEAAEAGLRLGLAAVMKEVTKGEKWKIAWYKLANMKKGWKAKNPTFTPYIVNKNVLQQEFGIESFRLQVRPSILYVHAC